MRAVIRRFVGLYRERYGPGGFRILAIVYVARLARPARAGSDVAEVRWFRPAAIPWREIAFPSVRLALRAYLTSSGQSPCSVVGRAPPRQEEGAPARRR